MTGRSTPGTWTNSRGVTMARLLAVVGSFRTGSGCAVLLGQLLLGRGPAVQHRGPLGQRNLLRQDVRVHGVGVGGGDVLHLGELVFGLLGPGVRGRPGPAPRSCRSGARTLARARGPPAWRWLAALPGAAAAYLAATPGNGLPRRAGAGNRRGPGRGDAGTIRLADGGRGCFRRQLQQPQLAPGGRSARRRAGLLFRQVP